MSRMHPLEINFIGMGGMKRSYENSVIVGFCPSTTPQMEPFIFVHGDLFSFSMHQFFVRVVSSGMIRTELNSAGGI